MIRTVDKKLTFNPDFLKSFFTNDEDEWGANVDIGKDHRFTKPTLLTGSTYPERAGLIMPRRL